MLLITLSFEDKNELKINCISPSNRNNFKHIIFKWLNKSNNIIFVYCSRNQYSYLFDEKLIQFLFTILCLLVKRETQIWVQTNNTQNINGWMKLRYKKRKFMLNLHFTCRYPKEVMWTSILLSIIINYIIWCTKTHILALVTNNGVNDKRTSHTHGIVRCLSRINFKSFSVDGENFVM